jgi:hypothetical protein
MPVTSLRYVANAAVAVVAVVTTYADVIKSAAVALTVQGPVRGTVMALKSHVRSMVMVVERISQRSVATVVQS